MHAETRIRFVNHGLDKDIAAQTLGTCDNTVRRAVNYVQDVLQYNHIDTGIDINIDIEDTKDRVDQIRRHVEILINPVVGGQEMENVKRTQTSC